MLLPKQYPRIVEFIFDSMNDLLSKCRLPSYKADKTLTSIWLNHSTPFSKSRNSDYYVLSKCPQSGQLSLDKYGQKGFIEIAQSRLEHLLIQVDKDKDNWFMLDTVKIFRIMDYRDMIVMNKVVDTVVCLPITHLESFDFPMSPWRNYRLLFVGWLYSVTTLYDMRATTKPSKCGDTR